MSISIVALHVKTESGDGYLFLYDQIANPEEFLELVEHSLGEELDYVSDYDIQVLYGDSEIYCQALSERINN